MNWLQLALVCFTAAVVAAVIVLTRDWHGRWTGDPVTGGVQKHHHGAPPRVGVVPLVAGLALGWIFLRQADSAAASTLGWMLVAASPAVLLGLADDVTKRVEPKARLVGAAASAMLAMWLLGNIVPRVDVPGLDQLLVLAPVGWLVTLLMVCGFINAMNIVDGLNGLATMTAVAMACATGFVAWQLGDLLLTQLCLVLAAAVLGFFLLNFPRGITFLGDGGAYLIGFMLAQLWIMLLVRHPEVSPWFVMAIASHPTIETVFSIYRRRFMRARSGAGAMKADRLHLHSLVYRRWALRVLPVSSSQQRWRPNALASSVIVLCSTVPMLVSMWAPTVALWSLSVLVLYSLLYLLVFGRLTRRSLMNVGENGRGARGSAATLAELSGR